MICKLSGGSDQASDQSRDLIHPRLELEDRFNLSEAWNLPIIRKISLTTIFVVKLKPNIYFKYLYFHVLIKKYLIFNKMERKGG